MSDTFKPDFKACGYTNPDKKKFASFNLFEALRAFMY
jgi:hypothetical protein